MEPFIWEVEPPLATTDLTQAQVKASELRTFLKLNSKEFNLTIFCGCHKMSQDLSFQVSSLLASLLRLGVLHTIAPATLKDRRNGHELNNEPKWFSNEPNQIRLKHAFTEYKCLATVCACWHAEKQVNEQSKFAALGDWD